MMHILCHNIASDGRRGTKHTENRDELFPTVAKPDCERKKKKIPANQLEKGACQCLLQIAGCFFEVKSGTHCHKSKRRRSSADAGDRL